MGGIIQTSFDPKYKSIELNTPDGDGDEIGRRLQKFLTDANAKAHMDSMAAQIRAEKKITPEKTDIWGDLKAVVPETLYPPKLVLRRGKTLYDFNGGPGGRIVSQRFKEAVEAIDPNVHQFVPVAVEMKDGTICPNGPFHFFRVQRVLNAINPTGSTGLDPVAVNATMGDLEPFQIHAAAHFSVYSERIQDVGIWADMRSPLHIFVSDRLLDKLLVNAPQGWDIIVRFIET